MRYPNSIPWIQYRDTSLYAVPSIHHRLVFAQMVWEACRRKPFDVIAVELPPSNRELVEQSLSLLPHPSLLVNLNGQAETLPEVPFSDLVNSERGVPDKLRTGTVLPATVCDSIVMALRCPSLLREIHPDWDPEILLVDDEVRPRHREESPLAPFSGFRDDYEVSETGLLPFLERMSGAFSQGKDPVVDDRRERIMSARLQEQLDRGKEILFVCGAAHWESISRYLDEEVFEIPELTDPPDTANALVAPIDPGIAWVRGWLDDIPFLTWEFEMSCKNHRSFDKVSALEILERDTLTRAGERDVLPSPRKLARMKVFSDRLSASEGRWIPCLGKHLAFAAESCVGTGFSGTVTETALTFPSRLPRGMENAELHPYDENHALVCYEDEAFLLEFPALSSATPPRSRGEWLDKAHLTEGELKELASKGGTIRDWPDDQVLAYEMADAARFLVAREECRSSRVSQKWSGRMGAGPDLRRTIRAKAGGDHSIFVRQEVAARRKSDETRSIPVTPIVWVFDWQADYWMINGNTGWFRPETLAHLSVTYVLEVEWLSDRRISSNSLAAMIDIGRSKAFLPRRAVPSVKDGKAEMEADSRYLQSLPRNKLCRDPHRALMGLEGSNLLCAGDHATAMGIRFAKDRIILVAEPGCRISPVVRRYAAEQGVEITRLSMQSFARQRVERFQLNYWVRCPGRDCYEQPYDWCSRFIPPMNEWKGEAC